MSHLKIEWPEEWEFVSEMVSEERPLARKTGALFKLQNQTRDFLENTRRRLHSARAKIVVEEREKLMVNNAMQEYRQRQAAKAADEGETESDEDGEDGADFFSQGQEFMNEDQYAMCEVHMTDIELRISRLQDEIEECENKLRNIRRTARFFCWGRKKLKEHAIRFDRPIFTGRTGRAAHAARMESSATFSPDTIAAMEGAKTKGGADGKAGAGGEGKEKGEGEEGVPAEEALIDEDDAVVAVKVIQPELSARGFGQSNFYKNPQSCADLVLDLEDLQNRLFDCIRTFSGCQAGPRYCRVSIDIPAFGSPQPLLDLASDTEDEGGTETTETTEDEREGKKKGKGRSKGSTIVSGEGSGKGSGRTTDEEGSVDGLGEKGSSTVAPLERPKDRMSWCVVGEKSGEWQNAGLLPFYDLKVLKIKYAEDDDVNDEYRLAIFYPFALNGSLQDIIDKISGRTDQYVYDHNLILTNLTAVGKSLGYLHRKNLVHGNIRTSNIFLSKDANRLLLGDFLPKSQAIRRFLRMASGQLAVEPVFLSPEVFHAIRDEVIDETAFAMRVDMKKHDVFCLGLTLYNCLTRKTPDRRMYQSKTYLRNALLTLPTTTDELRTLLTRMLQWDPAHRVDLDSLITMQEKAAIVSTQVRNIVKGFFTGFF